MIELRGAERVDTPVVRELRVRHCQIAQRVPESARRGHHLHDVARPEVAGAHERRLTEHSRVISIPVRLQIRQSAVERQSIVEKTGPILRTRALRAERSAFELQPSPRAGSEWDRLEIHRPGERCGAGAARTDAALDLYRLEAAREIGKIREVQNLIFRIVQRDAVNR